MNLFELFVKIGVKDEASKNIGNISSKLGNGLATAAKIGTAAVSAASAGIVALTKQAVENYAEYEQLVGGVDTLFKNSSKKVQEYADNAYKTAGLSANQYMSTVTSFSASLLQSLGGDTVKAAEYAQTAIVDMSDNANKMGTDMQMIQNAYQGFAKQNYTMLDNLKLGYGGTKEEMQRLLADAEKISGIKYDISSFADITQAIHVMQEEMGIAGTTAKEAGTTIEGSVSSMKAAWQNLITGLADGEADIEGLVSDLVTTIVGDGTESNLGVLGNVMPAVKTALNGASRLVSEMIPIIIKEVPPIITENLPVLAEGAIAIVQGLMDGISENQENLFPTIFDLIVYLANSFVSMLPQIVQLGFDLIVSLTTGLADSLPELMPTVVSVILEIVRILTAPENLSKLLQAALEIIVELAYGLMDAIPELVGAVVDIVTSICEFLLEPENISLLLSAALEVVLAIGSGLISSIPQLAKSVGKLILSIKDTFKETDWGKIGKDLVAGFRKGIEKAWGNLKEWFKGLFGDLTDIAKKILGIASPSKVFKKIGGFTIEGLDEGLEENAEDPIRTIEDISSQLTSAFDPSLSADYITSYDGYGSSAYGGSSSAYSSQEASSSVNITFGEKAFYIANFNGNSESEVDNFVDAVIDKLTSKIQSREAVFA